MLVGRAQHRDLQMSASLTSSLVGRSAERAAGLRFVEELADGPAALLVEGEAGIGKTMLWRAVATAAVERGHLVVSATAVDDETDLPFVALRDLFDGVAAPAEALPPVQRDAWDTALLRSTQPIAAADHQAVSAAVLGVVRALNLAGGPLVVAVDDGSGRVPAARAAVRRHRAVVAATKTSGQGHA
jgi:predicted ATPase